jgi:hypothetical protein
MVVTFQHRVYLAEVSVRRVENMLMVAIRMNGEGYREILGVCEGVKEDNGALKRGNVA